MKYLLFAILFITPAVSYADKYDDVATGLREVLIALSQMQVLGKDASTYSQVQGALGAISKDIQDLKKEYKATQDEVMECRKEKETTK